MKEFKVGVFECEPGAKRRPQAYTVWYSPAWKGCCEHIVRAVDGKAAKRIAIDEHIALCRQPTAKF